MHKQPMKLTVHYRLIAAVVTAVAVMVVVAVLVFKGKRKAMTKI